MGPSQPNLSASGQSAPSPLLLDGAAVGQAVRRHADAETLLDFINTGRVEFRSEAVQQAQDRRRGIGLYRIVDIRPGRGVAERKIVPLDNIEIDHQTRRPGSLIGEESRYFLTHLEFFRQFDERRCYTQVKPAVEENFIWSRFRPLPHPATHRDGTLWVAGWGRGPGPK